MPRSSLFYTSIQSIQSNKNYFLAFIGCCYLLFNTKHACDFVVIFIHTRCICSVERHKLLCRDREKKVQRCRKKGCFSRIIGLATLKIGYPFIACVPACQPACCALSHMCPTYNNNSHKCSLKYIHIFSSTHFAPI